MLWVKCRECKLEFYLMYDGINGNTPRLSVCRRCKHTCKVCGNKFEQKNAKHFLCSNKCRKEWRRKK